MTSNRCRFVRCDLQFSDVPSSGCSLAVLCIACAYPATRVDSASFVKTLADYGKQYKGAVKVLSPPSVAPDRLWRLGEQDLGHRMANPCRITAPDLGEIGGEGQYPANSGAVGNT